MRSSTHYNNELVTESIHNRDEHGLRSLRRQYLAAAAFLIVFVFASAWVAQTYIASIKAERSSNIEIRNRVALHTRLLRNAVQEISTALDAFMWSPSKRNRERVHSAIGEAMARQRALLQQHWLKKAGLHKAVGELGRKLDAMRQKLARVMDIRTNKQKQFPAMRYLQEEANPAHRAFLAAARLAIEESGTDGEENTGLRIKLIAIRSNWALMVAHFRMYLANRVGALIGSSGITDQQGDIEMLFGEVRKELDALGEADGRGELSLEVSDSLARMRHAARDWFLAYRKVRAIDTGSDWRADVPFLRTTVEPAFHALWQTLQTVDRALDNPATRYVTTSTDATHSLLEGWGIRATARVPFTVT